MRRALIFGLLLGACGSDSSSATPMPDAAVTSADAPAPDASTGDLIVTLDDGRVQADLVGDTTKVRRFLKIPFAKPPVAGLRWKAPAKPDPWSDVRHETDFSSPCVQAVNQQNAGSTDEDCLYLNVWSPEPAPAGAPVMLWMHGGGNMTGSAGDKLPVPGLTVDQQPLFYDGQFFAAKQGVVLVSINYRVGVMGFFPDPRLAAEQSPVGNQGLLDQRLAMQWVHDNIARFGGDPGNVTIFGESAGSFDVCFHMAAPGSRGLFHRAIGESGGCTAGLRPAPTPSDTTVASKLAAFTHALGCDTAGDPLACLRGKPAANVLGAVAGNDDAFVPVIDGAGGTLPEEPEAIFDRGDVAQVPYLIGSNTNEGRLFTYPLLLTGGAPHDQPSYVAQLQVLFGSLADQVAAEYPASDYGDVNSSSTMAFFDALSDALGDSGLVCGTHDTARRAAKAGLHVFMYNFNVPWSIAPDILLASHAAEIGHVFNDPWMPDAASQMVSDTMNTYWAHFAKTGDPNFTGAPTWPGFAPDADGHDLRLQLDPGFEVLHDFKKDKCDFWRSLYR
jgi:para-nitrobenzyl esterase